MTYIPNRDFNLEIAKGNIPKHSLLTRLGHNTDVDTGTAEDLQGQGGTYTAPTAARVHAIASTSVNDTSAGTGMRTALVYGINGSYARITETVTMDGTTPVNTVNSYLHIHLMQNTSSGSLGINQGVITATAAVDATVTCQIDALEGQSAQGVYLVPAGYKAYIVKLRARMNNSTANSAATMSLFTLPFGLGWQQKTQIGINNSGSSYVELDLSKAPYIVPGKSFIKLRCMSVTNNNTDIQGEYDIILVQD